MVAHPLFWLKDVRRPDEGPWRLNCGPVSPWLPTESQHHDSQNHQRWSLNPPQQVAMVHVTKSRTAAQVANRIGAQQDRSNRSRLRILLASLPNSLCIAKR
jgi:hypothetical protein